MSHTIVLISLATMKDEAYQKRELLEGNPNNPRDLHNEFFVQHRFIDAERLAAYMKSRGLSTQWWEDTKSGKIPPMQRLKENDPNNQVVSFDKSHRCQWSD
jgi:hypothetical protein